MGNAAEGHLHPPKAGWLSEKWGGWKENRRRRKIDGLLDLPEKEAAPRIAKLKFPPPPYLIAAVDARGEKSAKAAYLIGRLAEAGVECGDAVMPLYGLLQDGNEIEKGMAGVALARMWSAESVSMLIAGIGDKNNVTRLYSAVGLGMAPEKNPPAERALLKAAESDWDPKVRGQAQKSLDQIAELQQ